MADFSSGLQLEIALRGEDHLGAAERLSSIVDNDAVRIHGDRGGIGAIRANASDQEALRPETGKLAGVEHERLLAIDLSRLRARRGNHDVSRTADINVGADPAIGGKSLHPACKSIAETA
ncbi:MAG: hypothetical protein WDN28_24690 [Chthoniobacter sp.]